MHDSHSHHAPANGTKVEYIKFALIVLLIVTLSQALFMMQDSDALNMLNRVRIFMGVFMVVFATFKFVGYKMFVEMFPMYDFIAIRSKLFAQTYPFIELVLGLLAIFNLLSPWREVTVAIVMGVGAAGIINQVYIKKKKIHCACLGNIIKLPLSTVSLFEDVLMVGLALYMLAA